MRFKIVDREVSGKESTQPFIPLILSQLQLHNQPFFGLLTGKTPSSIPVKIIVVPICMTKLLAVLVGN